jgi:hypothetical protein
MLAKESKKQKPIISLEEVKKLLGLDSVDKGLFKQVLDRAAIIAEEKGVIYFGVAGDYIYFEEPLLQIVKKKLTDYGQADITEIANEIYVDSKLLKTIYGKLIRHGILENLKISNTKITPYSRIRKSKSME